MEPRNINYVTADPHPTTLLSTSFPFIRVSSNVPVCSLAGRSLPPQPFQHGLLPIIGPLYPVIAAGPSERTEHSAPVAPIASPGTAPLTEAALNLSITKFHGTGAPLYSLHFVTWTPKQSCLDPKSHKVLLAKSPRFLP